ncbi:MAG TPA: peroxidase [Bradyrhizobium sp.]|nr:peroxidase [Bradyrhizobium sp.]
MRSDIDAGDIQAIARTAFGSLKSARYLLLRIADVDATRRWLSGLAPASVAHLHESNPADESAEIYQIALTAAGLSKLGIREDILTQFSPEFVEGMAGSENRSRRLGDTGANAPEHWEWGVDEKEPHILLILLSSADRGDAFTARMREQVRNGGLSVMIDKSDSDMGGHEPFGFVDGISQPKFDWDRVRIPGTTADQDYTNLLALGELLLGYRNEYGLLTDRPLLASSEKNTDALPPGSHGRRDLGRNGSYLVYRQLAQDVRQFWRWVAEAAARSDVTMDEMAQSMVGRNLDGQPLGNLNVGRSIPGVSACNAGRNGFLFDTDPDGLSCPLGAHIRRANPRTGDAPGGRSGPLDRLLIMLGLTTRRDNRPTSSTLPWPRNTTVWPFIRSEDDAVASARFHRILRRAREYGTKLSPQEALDPATPDPEAGLHFLCLNANIARQFEFVQSAWIASAKFAALTGEQDPLLGNREPFPTTPIATPVATDGFSRPGAAPRCRHLTGLPNFVRVRGGAYFFLPGLAALKWIASG